MQYPFVLVLVFSYLQALGLALPAASSAQNGNNHHHRFLARGVKRLGARSPQNNDATPQGQTGASQGQNNTASGGRNGVSDVQVMNAVMSWMQDTAKVTKFLNTATSFTGAEFTKQATIALNAEIDELNHKMVLDAAFQGTDTVAQANAVLDTQGKFQQVVDTLQSMVTNGPDTAQKDVDSINNNRCVNVLPNIDMYFAAAGAPQVQAVRPTGCLEVEGANVTPAVPPRPPANGGGANNGGAAAPQVTPRPAAPNGNGQGNGNGNGNGNGQAQNGNGQNNNQNQNQNQNQNEGNGNDNSNDNANGNANGNSNQSQNQNQGSNGQNIGKGIGGNNQNNNNQLQPAKLGSQNSNSNTNTNSNSNNGNGNRNGNGNNQGQRQPQQQSQQSQQSQNQGRPPLQPAQLGSPKPANN
ncbi:hypothetical protein CDEST_02373 [Colletotrichum destructivum]|uniref:Uncharacterized protein n=1 Tax=Colletotrichum destructivum TaxID=34406 RepID=A0AAX4I1V5_9PEZI|nr:hypothetical protein CDEST_02373 [Colletotrichum destructivum]